MKSLLVSALSLFVTVAIASTDPIKNNISIEGSTINWTGKKVTGQHTGTVDLKSADLIIESGMIKGGEFEIDMTTIKVTDLSGNTAGKLEGHLKSDDFFGVSEHPIASLVITDSVKSDKPNTYNIKADATIKGITQPIEFTAVMEGNNVMADITIDRSKHNVKYGSGSFFEGLGDKMIYDDFTLEVNLRLN